MYIFQADTYCDSCGERLRYEIHADHRPTSEEYADSDTYPQSVSSEATDTPDHCASGVDCLEPIDLGDYGLALDATLYGAESTHIGALLSDGLTEEGARYTLELLAEPDPTPYQAALFALWRDAFADELAP